MQISNLQTQNPNFKSINLSKVEKATAKSLLSQLNVEVNEFKQQKIKTEIFNLFDKHIKKEVSKYEHSKTYIYEDLLQKMYSTLFELVEKYKPNKNPLISILRALDRLKPNIKEDGSPFFNISIDKVTDEFKRSLAEKITEKDLPVYATPAPTISRQKAIEKAQKLEGFATLTPKEQLVLIENFKGNSNKENLKKAGILLTDCFRYQRRICLKIQKANNILPEEYHNIAKILKEKYKVKISLESMTNSLIRNSQLVDNYDIKTIESKISILANMLKTDEIKMANTAIKNLNILKIEPDLIAQKLELSPKLLNISKEKFIKMGLSHPDLLVYKSETLKENYDEIKRLFNLDDDVAKKLFVYPEILYKNPKTLYENVKKSAKFLKVDTKSYLKAALAMPALFCRAPETIKKRIENLAIILDKNFKTTVKVTMNAPRLIFYTPEHLEDTIEQGSKNLGITRKEYIKKGLVCTNLFVCKSQSTNKKAQILNYYNILRGNPADIRKTGYATIISSDNLYSKCLSALIKKIDSNLRISQSCHAYKELYEYLIKNKGKEFVFTVPENLVLADLKEFAQILSEKINGKNVFIWKIEK